MSISFRFLVIIFGLYFWSLISLESAAPLPVRPDRPRVAVLTDIANEPDDEESMVRFLVSNNEFQVVALIATTSCWLQDKTHEPLIRRQIAAYEKVLPNLIKHAEGYAEAESLRQVTFSGQTAYGMAATGEGKSTAGSQHLAQLIEKEASSPLWISIWGGANTLAQALMDLRKKISPDVFSARLKNLRVYTISDQDDAGPWLRQEFPDLFYIVDPSAPRGAEYYRATWTGISGEVYYQHGDARDYHLVDHPWLEQNIMKNHGPLGELYPRWAYIMEGDTPSYLGLIDTGLGWEIEPSYGGWGGRYLLYQSAGQTRPIWTSNRESRDQVTLANGAHHTSNQATIWRWRRAYQHDFAARMDWCVASEFSQANHPPQVVLNGDTSTRVIFLKATAGDKISLRADGSSDPDKNALDYQWYIYREAGTLSRPHEGHLDWSKGAQANVDLSGIGRKGTLHIIVEVTDQGLPALTRYRRAVIQVMPQK